jgi:hypothetical protein
MSATIRPLRPGGTGGPPPTGEGDAIERLAKLETRIDAVFPMLATKGDVSEAKSDIIKWLAGIAFAIVAIIISVLAFMLNRAVPLQPPTQPAPIIIYPQQANPPALQSPPASKRDR